MKKLFILLLCTAFSLVSFSQELVQGLPKQATRQEIQTALHDGYVTPSARGIETPPDFPNIRAAAEWEEIQALTIAWQGYSGILKQIVAAAVNECEVIVLTENATTTQNYLLNGDFGGPVDLTNVTLITTPLNSIWMRDYGANTVYGDEVDDLFLVDWIYNRPRPDDDVSPEAVADYLGLDLYSTTADPNDLMNTGGNYMSDGFGTAFASELVIEENQGGNTGWGTQYPNQNETEIDGIMNSFMGIDTYIKMPNLPFDGIHHIDMHMKLINEETILVSDYPEGVADGPQIEANINYVLNNFTTKFGTPFNIVKLPVPPQASNGNYPDQGGWYCTYTNSVFVNNTVLVPTYYTEYDTTALRIYQEQLPGYNIVPIDCDNSGNAIISASGAIHCITQSVGVEDPLLISYACLPLSDDEAQDYTLEAYINHRTGVANATLFYTTDLDDPYVALPMTNTMDNNWEATIPAFPFGTTVYYYVEGVAVSGKVQNNPMPAPLGYKSFQIVNEVLGCTDPTACNYDETATLDDGSCVLPDGCTDVAACNYNPAAICDDGSCIIGELNTLIIETDCWGNETSWNIQDEFGTVLANGNGYNDQTTYTIDVCLGTGCYDFFIFDSFGDGMAGTASGCDVDGYYQFLDAEGTQLFEMTQVNFGDNTSHSFCITQAILGCTDVTACNYNDLATDDDGSCVLPDGCTDSAACNYDASATCDDGSCILPDGCTDSAACNYNAAAVCDDGSCLLPDGCTNSEACNYDPEATCNDGSCDFMSCLGCTIPEACNYDPLYTIEDGSCLFPTVWYVDADEDGFGDPLFPISFCDNAPAGAVNNSLDCDDTNPDMYFGAPGTFEGIDNDCNGTIEGNELLPSTCLGDIDDNGIINTGDLLMLLADYGCLENCSADLNDDSIVNTADLLILLGVYGEVCP